MNGKPFDTGELEHSVAELCANARQAVAPIEESARGYRDVLIKEHGWADYNAENIAMNYFQFVSTMFMKGVEKVDVDVEQDGDNEPDT